MTVAQLAVGIFALIAVLALLAYITRPPIGMQPLGAEDDDG